LFKLTGEEKIYEIKLCGDKKTFSTDVTLKRFGIDLPSYCNSVTSFDVTNYCSLGSKKGENVMMYYSRPTRYINCNILSSSGEILNVKRYGVKKELKLINEEQISEDCTNATFQLVNIIIE